MKSLVEKPALTLLEVSGCKGFGNLEALSKKYPGLFELQRGCPPKDPVNALLSFVYTLLTNEVISAIKTCGLDPYLRSLHEISYGRPSLACDLVEAGENISQNRESRKQIRSQRTPAPKRSDSMGLTKENIGGIIADELQEKKVDAARANELLEKLSDLGIERKQSKKWENKFSVLESIAGIK